MTLRGWPSRDPLLRQRAGGGQLPGGLLLAPPRPDPGRAAAGGDRDGDRHLGPPRPTTLGASLPLGAGVREQGRGHGLLEPAPARADLGVEQRCPTRPPPRIGSSAPTCEAHGRPLLLDYAGARAGRGARAWCWRRRALPCVVPFWAVWPFETLILPRGAGGPPARAGGRGAARSGRAAGAVAAGLRPAVRRLLPLLDGLARGALRSPGAQTHWQLHAHVYPPLVRSATVKKFMVGYEMLGEPQRDLTRRGRGRAAAPAAVRRDLTGSPFRRSLNSAMKTRTGRSPEGARHPALGAEGRGGAIRAHHRSTTPRPTRSGRACGAASRSSRARPSTTP